MGKKVFSAVMAVMLACAMLVGCGNAQKQYVGSWAIDHAEGSEAAVGIFELAALFDVDMTVDVYEDGQIVLRIEEDATNGTWTYSRGALEASFDDGSYGTLTIEDGQLLLESYDEDYGSYTLYCTRADGE